PLDAAQQKRLDELGRGKDVNIPFTVRWTEGARQAELEVQGTRFTLKQGECSGWIPLTFKFNFLVKPRGMVQFHVIHADREVQISASAVNMGPRDPPSPSSARTEFAPALVKELRLYRALGWAEGTWPLNEGRLDEADFLYDCDRAFDDRERI